MEIFDENVDIYYIPETKLDETPPSQTNFSW